MAYNRRQSVYNIMGVHGNGEAERPKPKVRRAEKRNSKGREGWNPKVRTAEKRTWKGREWWSFAEGMFPSPQAMKPAEALQALPVASGVSDLERFIGLQSRSRFC